MKTWGLDSLQNCLGSFRFQRTNISRRGISRSSNIVVFSEISTDRRLTFNTFFSKDISVANLGKEGRWAHARVWFLFCSCLQFLICGLDEPFLPSLGEDSNESEIVRFLCQTFISYTFPMYGRYLGSFLP